MSYGIPPSIIQKGISHDVSNAHIDHADTRTYVRNGYYGNIKGTSQGNNKGSYYTPINKMDLMAYYSYCSHYYGIKFFYNRSSYISCSLFQKIENKNKYHNKYR